MPMYSEWRMPELFVRHRGVSVYHMYHDDEMTNGTDPYKFTLDPYNDQESRERDGVIFIDDFENPNDHDIDESDGRYALIIEMIEAGVLGQDGLIHRPESESK